MMEQTNILQERFSKMKSDLTLSRLSQIMKEQKEWSSRCFKNNETKGTMGDVPMGTPMGPVAPLLGMMEELGEFSAACLQRDQEQIKDAIGDQLIYFIDFCNRMNIHPLTITSDTFSEEIKREIERDIQSVWTLITMYCVCLGKVCHVCLKRIQGIRGYDEDQMFQNNINLKVSHVWFFLQILAKREADMDSIEILEQVWDKVKLRDWEKNRKGAADDVEAHKS